MANFEKLHSQTQNDRVFLYAFDLPELGGVNWRPLPLQERKAKLEKTKVADGSAMLTRTHHRQTPLFLKQDAVDAGVTWQSEAIFQEQIGNPISYVDIPDAQNTTTIYAGAEVGGALIRKRRGLGSISFVLRKRWRFRVVLRAKQT